MSRQETEKTFEEMQALGFDFYNKDEVQSDKFIQIPKQFYSCLFYRQYLTPTSRELYGLLKDRMSLSKKTTNEGKNTYVDDNGFIYLVFSRESIGTLLGLSKQTVSDNFRILNKLGLIFEKRLGQGSANHIYIGKVKYIDENGALKLIQTIENNGLMQKSKKSTSKSNVVLKSKKSTSKSNDFRTQDVENLDATNTDLINTDLVVVVEASDTLKKYTIIKNSFETNICKLKPSTSEKLRKYTETLPLDLLMCAIDYCTEINTKSFAGFMTSLESFLSKGIRSGSELENYIQSYRIKNSQLRDQEQKKREERARIHSKSNLSKTNFADYEQRPFDPTIEKKLLGWE